MKQLLTIVVLLLSLNGIAQDTLNPEAIKVYPTLWQQQAAEYRALCYQAFNTASLRLEQVSAKKIRKSRAAIITDLDETILDNSYLEAQLIKDHKGFSGMAWKTWSDKSAATSVPGASDFLKSAKKRGVSIFYISNRSVAEVSSTLINLQKLGLPDADTSHMLFLSTIPSKEARRQTVMKKFNVIMLLGDNLNDFTKDFEGEDCDKRKIETDKARAKWGRKFIVLPNASYGEWENAIYDYDSHLNAKQKEEKRNAKLIGF